MSSSRMFGARTPAGRVVRKREGPSPAMRHLALFRYALAANCSLEEAGRRRASEHHAVSMARLAAKGWTP